MKRHQSLAPISREHHHFLVLSQVLRKDTPPYRGMPTDSQGKVALLTAALKEQLKPHMEREENHLFPFISGLTPEIDLLLAELIGEHRAIEAMIHQLDTVPDVVEHLHEIGVQLALHVRKEERELFQQVQQQVDDTTLGQFCW